MHVHQIFEFPEKGEMRFDCASACGLKFRPRFPWLRASSYFVFQHRFVLVCWILLGRNALRHGPAMLATACQISMLLCQHALAKKKLGEKLSFKKA